MRGDDRCQYARPAQRRLAVRLPPRVLDSAAARRILPAMGTPTTPEDDDALVRHQQRINDLDDRISTMQLTGDTRAQRLRQLHERVSGDFLRLRRAFGDDWQRIRTDAQAGWRELMQEISSVDATAVGFHDEQLETFDHWLDDMSHELEQLHTDDEASLERRLGVDAAGVVELRAQVAAARDRRDALPGTPSARRQAAEDGYEASVRQIAAKMDQLKPHA
jgi:hypothetical protein